MSILREVKSSLRRQVAGARTRESLNKRIAIIKRKMQENSEEYRDEPSEQKALEDELSELNKSLNELSEAASLRELASHGFGGEISEQNELCARAASGFKNLMYKRMPNVKVTISEWNPLTFVVKFKYQITTQDIITLTECLSFLKTRVLWSLKSKSSLELETNFAKINSD